MLGVNGAAQQAARRLGEIIQANTSEIWRRWLASVEAELTREFKVEPALLRDGLPAYLQAVAERLQAGHVVNSDERASRDELAREHGITRVQLGFDVSQLVREFVILRRVIRAVTVEQGADVSVTDPVLADVLDAAITTAVNAYVAHRDDAVRLSHAKHIGFLTHELRNPLSTAILATARVRQRATPEQQRALDALERSHRRLTDLIDSVLLNQRLASGSLVSQPLDVLLGELIESATEAARGIATQKGLAFRALYEPDLWVRLDPALSRSAIQNLSDNAAKYTDTGFVEVAVEVRAVELVIHVRDSGPGIPADELRKVFEPFERGKTRKAGTGLGLTICRQAVEVQGGSISAESVPGTGSHFWIVLPRRDLAR